MFLLLLVALGCKEKALNKSSQQNKTSSILKTSEKNTKVKTVQSWNDETKVIEEKDILLGNLNGKSIKFDRTTYDYGDGNATIYMENGNKKLVLFTYDYDGYHAGDIKLVHLVNHPFVYLTSTHSHGHFRGKLYALDLAAGKANLVDESKIRHLAEDIGSFKKRDLEFRNENGLLLDKNKNITSEDYYRNKEGENCTYKCSFKLKKIKNNTYVLVLVKGNMICQY